MKTFRDTPHLLSLEFMREFREVDQSKMRVVPARKISNLVDDTCIWIVYQKAFSFAGTRSQIIIYEVLPALISNLESDEKIRRNVCEHVEAELNRMQDEYFKLYGTMSNLAELKDELDEVRYFTPSALHSIPLRRNIRKAVAEISSYIQEDIESE